MSPVDRVGFSRTENRYRRNRGQPHPSRIVKNFNAPIKAYRAHGCILERLPTFSPGHPAPLLKDR